jgi:hypothetical protein
MCLEVIAEHLIWIIVDIFAAAPKLDVSLGCIITHRFYAINTIIGI